jgi:hypothetical protein
VLGHWPGQPNRPVQSVGRMARQPTEQSNPSLSVLSFLFTAAREPIELKIQSTGSLQSCAVLQFCWTATFEQTQSLLEPIKNPIEISMECSIDFSIHVGFYFRSQNNSKSDPKKIYQGNYQQIMDNDSKLVS